MRILIVGAGAVGGYFGALMHEAGRDVTFLLRPARAAAVRGAGLTIVEPSRTSTIAPSVITRDEIEEPFDAVLLSVKSYGLAGAIDDVAAAVGSETMVVPMLNGMAHIETLRDRFGIEATLGGVAMIASTLDDEGRIIHLNDNPGGFAYGEFTPRHGERFDQFDAAAKDCGFRAIRSDDIERAMWMKWVGLATIGATTCLMRAPTGAIARAPGGEVVATTILSECVAVASAWGYPPTDAEMKEWTERYTDSDSMSTSSMYRDLSAGLPTEGDQILGDLVVRAKARDVPVPTVTLAAIALSVADHSAGA